MQASIGVDSGGQTAEGGADLNLVLLVAAGPAREVRSLFVANKDSSAHSFRLAMLPAGGVAPSGATDNSALTLVAQVTLAAKDTLVVPEFILPDGWAIYWGADDSSLQCHVFTVGSAYGARAV